MFIGGSQAILRVLELIDKAARSSSTVLIIGETGVGKDVAANEIHARSKRSGRFLAVNCAAIPGDLIESELGHERGAFTSASTRRLGIFEQANGGTVFLDEITEMKPELQPKLLRILEEHRIRRIGGEESIPVNVRVIAATNRPLHEALEGGKLREDLYYRLNVFRIGIPPLRERVEDLDLLVAYFVEELNQEHGKEVDGLDAESLAALRAYSWPSNVRELSECDRARRGNARARPDNAPGSSGGDLRGQAQRRSVCCPRRLDTGVGAARTHSKDAGSDRRQPHSRRRHARGFETLTICHAPQKRIPTARKKVAAIQRPPFRDVSVMQAAWKVAVEHGHKSLGSVRKCPSKRDKFAGLAPRRHRNPEARRMTVCRRRRALSIDSRIFR